MTDVKPKARAISVRDIFVMSILIKYNYSECNRFVYIKFEEISCLNFKMYKIYNLEKP